MGAKDANETYGSEDVILPAGASRLPAGDTAEYHSALPRCASSLVKLRKAPGRVFKMIGDAVFEEKAGWQGATKANTPSGSLTEEQRRQTACASKNLRTAGLWAGSFVVEAVIARCGDIPASPADDRHRSLPAQIPRRRTPNIWKTRPRIFKKCTGGRPPLAGAPAQSVGNQGPLASISLY